ncbi:unnamed protein product [Meganyctiphanes norvegica]|uniref:Uncharacterized protein n=1 Tax=Meganyctiphanes norvegica TaxID=48144 RepID=A0AAV2S9V5_MEGNR
MVDYGGYAAASDYGGYASESGYGLTCASGYVNASAVALLAFLFLLNIVQDVIQSITNPRRRRDVGEAPSSDVFQFISDGGVDALKEGLPQLMIPLMVELVEASEAPECLQRPLCRVNADLVMEYGVVGRVVASLFSNVMAKAFTGDHLRHFHLALDAAKLGREGGDCGAYPACTGAAHKYDQKLNENHEHDNMTEETQNTDILDGLGKDILSSHLKLDNKLD